MSDSALVCVTAAGCVGGLVLGSLSLFASGGAATILILLAALLVGASVAATYQLRTHLEEVE